MNRIDETGNHERETKAMRSGPLNPRFSRRTFIKVSGLMAAGAAAAQVTGVGRLVPAASASSHVAIHLAATDGFVSIPGTVANPGGPTPYLPDSLAPAPFTMWGFGFRNVTGLNATQVQAQRGKFQLSAPMLWVDQEDEVEIKLQNLGLSVRPDLTDSHTIHWHGFRNAIPLFDGVPEMSVAVPLNRDFTYFYHPHEPGTYMYHCHFEDTEHVSMGMTGIIFVRPGQNAGAGVIPPGKYAYNDGVIPSDARSTAYDREYGMFLSDMWAQEHWEGAHIQEHDWSDYAPDIWLINGRTYPDTIAPNGGGVGPDGDLIAPAGHPNLQYQPISSLVNANAGDRVLLRFVNLGFHQHAMTIDGIPMRIVGKDATYLTGRDGTNLSTTSNTVYLGPGESTDAIFVAPNVASMTTFKLYSRNLGELNNPGASGLGGQMTEVRIHPAGSLAPQSIPQT